LQPGITRELHFEDDIDALRKDLGYHKANM